MNPKAKGCVIVGLVLLLILCGLVWGDESDLDVPEMHSVIGDSTNTRAEVTWFKHPTETVLGYRLYQSVDDNNWGPPIIMEDSLSREDTTVTIESLDNKQLYYFKLLAVDTTYQVPESDFSNTYCLRTTVGHSQVLIVDGFDRRSSWQTPGHPFAGWNGCSLDKLDISFEACCNEVVGNELSLNDYDAIIWILGDEGTTDETFDLREQELVKAYLEGGGQLFVTGSEIGYDLARGTSGDREFYNNYLKANYIGDDSNDYTVTGLAGTIFEGLSFSYGQTYEEDYPDYINAYGGSVVCLDYNATQHAGVQYSGVFGSGVFDGQLVYIAFPWETIGSETSRDQIMTEVMTFFEVGPDSIPPESIENLLAQLHAGSKSYGGNILLSWSEPYDSTGVHHYVIYRSESPTEIGDSLAITADTTYLDEYVYAIGNPYLHYYYTVKAVDYSGNKSEASNQVGEFDKVLDR
jgi:hypothetical protein